MHGDWLNDCVMNMMQTELCVYHGMHNTHNYEGVVHGIGWMKVVVGWALHSACDKGFVWVLLTHHPIPSLQVLEETGIVINSSDVQFGTAQNAIFPSGQHYVVIFMTVLVPRVSATTGSNSHQ